MAKVNLMPTGLAPAQQRLPLGIISKIRLALVLLNLFFLVLGISFFLVTMYKKGRLLSITAEYNQAEDLTNKINKLKRQQTESTAELNLLEGNLKKELPWSEELTQIRSLIPYEVWLRQLTFEKKEGKDAGSSKLYLQGGLIARGKKSPLEVLGVFVNSLKEDKVLGMSFSHPVLTDSRTETYRNVEVMTFAIEMPLK